MLAGFREKNLRRKVTGLLLYKQGSFMQALEGEEDTVRGLYGRICGDPRHHDVSTLAEIGVAERQFPDWSMKFEVLKEEKTASVPEYPSHPELPSMSDEMPWRATVALRLLATFRRKR